MKCEGTSNVIYSKFLNWWFTKLRKGCREFLLLSDEHSKAVSENQPLRPFPSGPELRLLPEFKEKVKHQPSSETNLLYGQKSLPSCYLRISKSYLLSAKQDCQLLKARTILRKV